MKKKLLSLVLTLALSMTALATGLIPAYADPVYVTSAKFTAEGFKQPAIGENIPAKSSAVTPEVNRFTVSNASVGWTEKKADGSWADVTGGKFKAGGEYRLKLDIGKLTLKTVEGFNRNNPPAVELNGIPLSIIKNDTGIKDSEYKWLNSTVTVGFVMYSAPFKVNAPAPVEYSITVKGGKAYKLGKLGDDKGVITKAKVGELVSIKANDAPAGYIFDKWVVEEGYDDLLADENEKITGFHMPAKNVVVRAIYKKLSVEPIPPTPPTPKPDNPDNKPNKKSDLAKIKLKLKKHNVKINSYNVYKKSIKLSWKKISIADRYTVAYKKNKTKRWSYKMVKKNQIKITKLSNNNRIAIKIAPAKVIGNKTIMGKYSKVNYYYMSNVKIKKLIAEKKKIRAVLKKLTGVTGYQIAHSQNSSLKNAKYKIFLSNKLSLKGLTAKKKYYIKARSYKKVAGKKYFGGWSKIKAVKVK